MATHSSILAWEIPQTEQPGGYSSWGRGESDMTEATKQQQAGGPSTASLGPIPSHTEQLQVMCYPNQKTDTPWISNPSSFPMTLKIA